MNGKRRYQISNIEASGNANSFYQESCRNSDYRPRKII